MLLKLIEKEILEHLMSLRFAIACILCLCVVLTSFFVRSKDYENVLSDYNYEIASIRDQSQHVRFPSELLRRRITIRRAPNPLKVFVRGVNATNGEQAQLQVKSPVLLLQPKLENTAIPLFPSIDLVVFVGLILSLMAIVFGFDAVCGEKQMGTLRLMLSYSVPRDMVLLAKWVGGYVTLVIPYVLAIIGLIALVLVEKRLALDTEQWTKLGAIFGLSLVYLATVYSLAILVSCLTSRGSTSIMLLVTIWVVLFLAVPNLSAPVAKILKPGRPVHEMDGQRREVNEKIDREVSQKYRAYLKAQTSGGKRSGGLFGRLFGSARPNQGREQHLKNQLKHTELYKQGDLDRQRAYEQIEEQFGGELEVQTQLGRWIARLSPFGCFAMAAAELADEGALAKRRFLKQAQKHQKEFTEYAYEPMAFSNQYQLDNPGKQPWPFRNYWNKPPPQFNYVPAAGMQYVRAVALDVGILGGMAILFFMLSYVRFLRYDVR